MKTVGIAGIGFMGWIHWLAYQKADGLQVTAICSRDPVKRSGDWTGIQGNFGPPGTQVNLQGIAAYDDFQAMLADDSLDLIDICLPPGMHEAAVNQALAAGKNVLCEKPMALNVAQCQSMLNTMEKSGHRLLVAHVLPFFPEFAYVYDLVKSNKYGAVQGGEFKRTVSDPTWVQGFYDPNIAGGPLIDLHVHDAHFIRALFGMPQAITSNGRWRGESIEYCASLFSYPESGLVVSSHGGVINQQGRPFTHAFEVRFENATAQFEFAAFTDQAESMPLKIVTEDGQVLRPEPGGDGDPVLAFVDELNEVARVLESGTDPVDTILDARFAADAIRLCELQTESVRSGRTVQV